MCAQVISASSPYQNPNKHEGGKDQGVSSGILWLQCMLLLKNYREGKRGWGMQLLCDIQKLRDGERLRNVTTQKINKSSNKKK